MGEELTKSLALLAERGASRGAIAVLEEARTQVAEATAPRRPSWRRAMLVAATSAAAVFILVGTAVFLAGPFGGEEPAPPTTVTPVFRAAPASGDLGPLNMVNDLAFSPDGHLWAATGAGLVQWDIATGDFVLFTEEDGVPGRHIETVEIAPDGTAWVADSGWIGRYDGSWRVFTTDNVSQLNGQLGDLVVDGEGVVWAAVASEPLARYDGSWESVAPPPGQDWPVITPAGLAVGPDGTLWLGTHSRGVFAFDGSNWRHFTKSDGAPTRASNVVAAPDGTIWAWGGGYYTDPELSSFVPATGFARYDGTTWRTFKEEDGLLSNDGSVVVTDDDTVWVVHAELGPDHEPAPIGLSRFDGSAWSTYPEIGGERTGSGSGAVVGADGTLWMPSASGIIAFDGSDTTRLIVPEELATPPVPPFTLIPDPELTPVRVSTMIGDFEFTTLRTPGQDVFDTESTPFGWMAHSGDMVYRSDDGLTWDAVLTDAEDLWIMADGPDLVVYGWGLVRYSWDGAGWAEVAAVDLPGRIQGLAFGPNGAVALVGNTVYYSTDGLVFSPAEAGPDSVQVDTEQSGVCAGWWPQISVAGPGAGPILVTETGYVLLAPANGNWDPLPMCEPLAWFSTDGNHWELLTPQSPFGESAAVADVAAFAGRFVAIGEEAAWVSDDGIDWQRAEVPQLNRAVGIAGGDLGWVLVGDSANSDNSGLPADMWFSADGLTWDGPYTGPEGLGYLYFHIEPTVGSDAIFSVNGGHDGFVIGRLQK